MLVRNPVCTIEEEIEFQRQSLWRRLQLTHHYNHIFIYRWVVAQPLLQPLAECGEVYNLFIFITAEVPFFYKFLAFVVAAERNAVHIYEY